MILNCALFCCFFFELPRPSAWSRSPVFAVCFCLTDGPLQLLPASSLCFLPSGGSERLHPASSLCFPPADGAVLLLPASSLRFLLLYGGPVQFLPASLQRFLLHGGQFPLPVCAAAYVPNDPEGRCLFFSSLLCPLHLFLLSFYIGLLKGSLKIPDFHPRV